jgi:pyruvate kinase
MILQLNPPPRWSGSNEPVHSLKKYRDKTLQSIISIRDISMQSMTDDLIVVVTQHLQEEKLVYHGEHIVIIGGLAKASHARTNFVKLHRIGD